MIHYDDLIKAEKMGYFSDYETMLFARAKGKTKSVTGVLPLTFTSKGGTAADWVIEGNDDVGKNLLEIAATSSTSSGVSYVANKNDGTIIANGTAQGNSTFQWNCELAAGSYVLSGCLSQGSTSTFGLNVSLLDWSQTWWDHGSGAVINLSETTTVRVRVVIYDGTTVNNLVFKPMIRKSDTSPDFEPYQQGVGERTANLWNEEWELGIWAINNGQKVDNLTNIRNKNKIPIESSTTYYWYNNKSDVIRFMFFDANGDYINSPIVTTKSGTVYSFTSPANAKFFCFYYGATEYENCVTLSITPPDHYIPYGYQIPITVSQQGQPDKNYDIYIGDSPLTEGETVSKTSTGVDIVLFEGENTVSTTLYNKPEMKIEYEQIKDADKNE